MWSRKKISLILTLLSLFLIFIPSGTAQVCSPAEPWYCPTESECTAIGSQWCTDPTYGNWCADQCPGETTNNTAMASSLDTSFSYASDSSYSNNYSSDISFSFNPFSFTCSSATPWFCFNEYDCSIVQGSWRWVEFPEVKMYMCMMPETTTLVDESIVLPTCSPATSWSCTNEVSCADAAGFWCADRLGKLSCSSTPCVQCSASEPWNCYSSLGCQEIGKEWCSFTDKFSVCTESAQCIQMKEEFKLRQREFLTRQIINELERSFAETEQLLGPLTTMERFQVQEGYPVDFVKEKLFQQYAFHFLHGEYAQATAVHLRIMKGLLGSSRLTVRKIDYALANYYERVLNRQYQYNKDELLLARPAIRATLGPALSVVEQLQYTGISLIRRTVDRDREWCAVPPCPIEENPFIQAAQHWPAEIGLLVYNYETGNLERLWKRQASMVEGTAIHIVPSRHANAVEGYLTYLIDERVQGANDCRAAELAKHDFTCPNDQICSSTSLVEPAITTSEGTLQTAGTDSSPESTTSKSISSWNGLFFDPTTPAEQLPLMEAISTNICDQEELRNLASNIAPFAKTGVCTPAGRGDSFGLVSSGAVQTSTITESSACVNELRQQERLQINLADQWGIRDLGCPLRDDTEPGTEDKQEDNDDDKSFICKIPIISIVCGVPPRDPPPDGEITRECQDEEECRQLQQARQQGAENWERQQDERTTCISDEYCQLHSELCDTERGRSYVRDLVSSTATATVQSAARGNQPTGPQLNFHILTDDGRETVRRRFLGREPFPQAPAGLQVSLGDRHHVIAVAEGYTNSNVVEHELAHVILDEVGFPDSTHHDVIERCTIPRYADENGDYPLENDYIEQGCSSSSRFIRDTFACIPGASETDALENFDPLAPYIYPDPTGEPTMPAELQPVLECAAEMVVSSMVSGDETSSMPPTGSRPGPDCNFLDVDCELIQTGGDFQSSPPGCGPDETPTDPEQCQQPVCDQDVGEFPVIDDRGRIQCVTPEISCLQPPCEE